MPYQCQKCGKETLWLRHKDTNNPAPIEAEPAANGNVFISGNLYRIATPDEIIKAKEIGKPLYLNHFATCEFAKSFAKKEPPKSKTSICKNCGLEMNFIEKEDLWFCPFGCSKEPAKTKRRKENAGS